MKRYQNLLLIAAVILLGALPLLMVERPATGPDGKTVQIFGGADDQAKKLIGEINPDYRPWFKSLIEPASGEIASMLFALQAALGAGFIGYYLGAAVTREKMKREMQQKFEKPAQDSQKESQARAD